jgi:hypothetical protein
VTGRWIVSVRPLGMLGKWVLVAGYWWCNGRGLGSQDTIHEDKTRVQFTVCVGRDGECPIQPPFSTAIREGYQVVLEDLQLADGPLRSVS